MSFRTLQMNLRRDRILNSARELVSTKGYASLTMRSLADAAGVTVPTIYNLIGNKDAVLGATIHSGTLRFWQKTGRKKDPVAILEAVVAEMLREPSYYRPILRVLTNGGAGEAMAELDEVFLENLRVPLEALADHGDLESWVDPAVLAARLRSSLNGVLSEWATGVLSDAALPLAASYDANIALAGVTTEKSRRRFQNRARRFQKRQLELTSGHTRVRQTKRSRDLA